MAAITLQESSLYQFCTEKWQEHLKNNDTADLFSVKFCIHQWLEIKLELPNWYGRNWDALWDCLTGWIGLPIELVWLQNKDEDFFLPANFIEELDKHIEFLLNLFTEAAAETDELTFSITAFL